jgi:hypothetical protein
MLLNVFEMKTQYKKIHHVNTPKFVIELHNIRNSRKVISGT